MPRPTTVTEDDVFAAAEAVAGRGLETTIAKVREALGNRGGGAQVAAALKAWKEQREVDGAIKNLGDLDDASIQLIHSLRQTLAARIDDDYAMRRAHADAEITAAQEKIEKSEAERDRALRDAELSEKTIKELSRNLQEAHKDGAHWQGKFQATEAKSTEVIGQLQRKVDDLKGSLEERAQQEAKQLSAFEQDKATLLKEKTALQRQHEKAAADFADQIKQLNATLVSVREELIASQQHSKDLAHQLIVETTRAKQVGDDNRNLQAQLNKLQALRDIDIKTVAKLERELTQERGVNAVAKREIKHVREELTASQRQNEKLQSSHQWLEGQFDTVRNNIDALRHIGDSIK